MTDNWTNAFPLHVGENTYTAFEAQLAAVRTHLLGGPDEHSGTALHHADRDAIITAMPDWLRNELWLQLAMLADRISQIRRDQDSTTLKPQLTTFAEINDTLEDWAL